jgi:hypothetical protein
MPAERDRPTHERRLGVLLGVFALLLQALLFAWHTHPLRFSEPGQPFALSAPDPASPVSPGASDDDCQICLSLHHLSAAPVIAPALPMPPQINAAVPAGEAVIAGSTPSAGFHARAPPARLT